MLTRKNYAKPPLLEVFCEFFFEAAEGVEWDGFLVPKLFAKLKDRFPTRQHLRTVGVQLRMEAAQGMQAERVGPPTPRHQFFSKDGKSLVQVGENLLVVNQLPPYYGWERFEPIVVTCYSAYNAIWKPQRIARAALHYVDKIDVPQLEFELKDYFNLYPVVPPEPQGSIANLAMAFEFPGACEGDILAVAFRQHPSADPGGTSFLLQFDYVAAGPLSAGLDKVREWINTAHDFTGRCFRNVITSKCEELFEGAA